MGLFLLLTLFSSITQAADLPKMDKITTTDGKEYSDVEVKEKLADGIKIVHSGGIGKIKAEHLPADLVERLGGFDKSEIEMARLKQQADKKIKLAEARNAEVSRRLDAATWEPFTSEIAKQEMNLQDPEYLATLRYTLGIIKKTCEPLLEEDIIDRKTVRRWIDCILDKTITKGMPKSLALLAWGEPRNINRNSSGSEYWHYPGGAMLSFDENDLIDFWSN